MSDIHKTIEAIWKIEATRLIAGIARVTRDVGRAEELAQDALVAALELWPEQGIPDKPAAWLMTAAKRRAIDGLRRGRMLEQKHGELARELEYQQQQLGEAMDRALDQVIDDDVLRLIFTACHPVLSVEGRVALTLRVACGLTTTEIARSFLVPEKTLGQRIFRAKKTLSEAHVPFETPRGEELRKRLESVLAVVYLIFNEGYTASSGEEWTRESLCVEAVRLGRRLAKLLPEEPDVFGLLALMELQASRAAARRGPSGEAILLPDQDRGLWDHAQIQRGIAALRTAQSLSHNAGSYTLQAAIAACHAQARTAADTDWQQIVLLYDALLQISQSPIVALNRAVAVGMAQGPSAGLDALDVVTAEPALANYHLLPSVRADLLMKLGRYAEAREELQRAIAMTDNVREHELLSRKLKQAMIPEPTPRLTFRSWTENDTALAEALWCDPEVTHYFGGAMTPEQARLRLEAERERESRLGIQYWPMFLRETGEFAGCAGLRPWQMDAETTEAGVHLMRSAWGLRLGEEALRAALAFGFDTLGLPKIVAGHGLGHDNSQKLLERVGFEYTHNIHWGPKEIEVRIYAITAEMWRAK